MFPSGEPGVSGDFSETERKPDVPASPRDEALFHCANPSRAFIGIKGGVPRFLRFYSLLVNLKLKSGT